MNAAHSASSRPSGMLTYSASAIAVTAMERTRAPTARSGAASSTARSESASSWPVLACRSCPWHVAARARVATTARSAHRVSAIQAWASAGTHQCAENAAQARKLRRRRGRMPTQKGPRRKRCRERLAHLLVGENHGFRYHPMDFHLRFGGCPSAGRNAGRGPASRAPVTGRLALAHRPAGSVPTSAIVDVPASNRNRTSPLESSTAPSAVRRSWQPAERACASPCASVEDHLRPAARASIPAWQVDRTRSARVTRCKSSSAACAGRANVAATSIHTPASLARSRHTMRGPRETALQRRVRRVLFDRHIRRPSRRRSSSVNRASGDGGSPASRSARLSSACACS